MGDKIYITRIEYIDQRDTCNRELYQIDLYNETKSEHYRTFIECEEFEKLLELAKEQ